VNQSGVVGYDTKDLLWQRQDNNSILNSSFVEVTFLSGQYKDRSLGPDGFFSLTVSNFFLNDFLQDSSLKLYSDILVLLSHAGQSSRFRWLQ